MILGTGRNGSASIAKALKELPNSLVTHERPPIVYWQDAKDQLDFHLRFSAISLRHFRFVIDVSHWWLPHLNYLKEAFGDLDVILLCRNKPDTVRSFFRIKGTGRGAINHWTNHDGDYWTKNFWDKCYPDVVDFKNIGDSRNDMHMLKVQEDCICNYIDSYNNEAKNYVEANKGVILDLESLFSNESKEMLFRFLHCEFEWRLQHLNAKGCQDSWRQSVFD
jgi:hypothetical protein